MKLHPLPLKVRRALIILLCLLFPLTVLSLLPAAATKIQHQTGGLHFGTGGKVTRALGTDVWLEGTPLTAFSVKAIVTDTRSAATQRWFLTVPHLRYYAALLARCLRADAIICLETTADSDDVAISYRDALRPPASGPNQWLIISYGNE